MAIQWKDLFITFPALTPRVILGIDPGVALAGYAFVHEVCGHLTLLACDVICTPPNTPLGSRLLTIYEQMTILLNRYRPTEVMIAMKPFLWSSMAVLLSIQGRMLPAGQKSSKFRGIY